MSSHARDFCIDCDRLADGLRRDHEAQLDLVKKLTVELVEKASAVAYAAGQQDMRERCALNLENYRQRAMHEGQIMFAGVAHQLRNELRKLPIVEK